MTKEALKQEEQISCDKQGEPVVTIRVVDEGYGAKDWEFVGINTFYDLPFGEHHIYTTPQPAQKPWVGLTDEEWTDAHKNSVSLAEFRKSIEALLKEKNT